MYYMRVILKVFFFKKSFFMKIEIKNNLMIRFFKEKIFSFWICLDFNM